jgi:hypothetical protein
VSDAGTGDSLLELHRPFRFVFNRLELTIVRVPMEQQEE